MASTIRDVAKKAGVAVSTASLVINDRPNVNPETKERVLQAVRELNFHPRRNARASPTPPGRARWGRALLSRARAAVSLRRARPAPRPADPSPDGLGAPNRRGAAIAARARASSDRGGRRVRRHQHGHGRAAAK